MKILALGDCNTLGIQESLHNAFPEKIAEKLKAEVVNLGHTMATTREGVELYNTVKDEKFDLILISFGLTDSWETFRYAPYVLYYPDNAWRKLRRKLVKKYKKIGRRLGFKKIFGAEPVVPETEYLSNLKYIVEGSKDAMILVLDTLPKKEEDRNVSIKKYNVLLDQMAAFDHVKRLYLYDYFDEHRELYLDKTHLNDEGYEYIADRAYELIKSELAINDSMRRN